MVESAYSFSQEAYDTHDHVKWEIVKFLNKKGNITQCVENYDADITAYKIVHHEVEHRTEWEGEDFPYSTIHIPYRKKKLFEKHNQFVYWVVNSDRSRAKYIQSGLFKNLTPKEIPNQRHKMGELFYDVPIGLWKSIKL